MITDIEEQIINLIRNNYNKLISNKKDKLLGKSINFTPVELAALLFEVEKIFSISICQDDILAGNFDSITNIARLVYQESKKCC